MLLSISTIINVLLRAAAIHAKTHSKWHLASANKKKTIRRHCRRSRSRRDTLNVARAPPITSLCTSNRARISCRCTTPNKIEMAINLVQTILNN